MRAEKRRHWTVGGAALAFALLFALPSLADTLRGTLRQVAPRTRRIVVTDSDGDDNHLRVAVNARVTLNGRAAKLADLQPGDQVVVVFSEDAEGAATASAIEAKRTSGASPQQCGKGEWLTSRGAHRKPAT